MSTTISTSWLVVAMAVLASHTAVLHADALYDPEARLADLHLTLPKPDAPIANYVRAVRVGNLMFVAGHAECGDSFLAGKAGGTVTVDQAHASAKRVGLCLPATLKSEVGDLRKVKQIVKVYGMVNGHARVQGSFCSA